LAINIEGKIGQLTVRRTSSFIKREFKNKYKKMCENEIKSFNENSKMFSNIKCSASSILLQVLQNLSILGILKYSPFSISRLGSLILILVKHLLISELL
jgi:hypothetical protein